MSLKLKILNDKYDNEYIFFVFFLEPNSSLVTSNIKGPLVGDLFWLYHRLK